MATAGSPDTFRQTGFVLRAETDALVDAFNLEAALAEGASGGKFRNQVVASALAYWSRSWSSRLQALHAIEWGNYNAALPLLRAAADYQSAGLALLESNAAEWSEWLDGGGVKLAPAQHATEFELHAFRSAETMVAHEALGTLYRIATDLSLPHFGATLLATGAESDPSRIAVTFGDRDFHLGWAELTLGLLQALTAFQLDTAVTFATVLGVADVPKVEATSAALKAFASRPDRCSVALVEVDGVPRLLVSNWRRNPGGAYSKVLL